jgi:hypothetical protein
MRHTEWEESAGLKSLLPCIARSCEMTLNKFGSSVLCCSRSDENVAMIARVRIRVEAEKDS